MKEEKEVTTETVYEPEGDELKEVGKTVTTTTTYTPEEGEKIKFGSEEKGELGDITEVEGNTREKPSLEKLDKKTLMRIVKEQADYIDRLVNDVKVLNNRLTRAKNTGFPRGMRK